MVCPLALCEMLPMEEWSKRNPKFKYMVLKYSQSIIHEPCKHKYKWKWILWLASHTEIGSGSHEVKVFSGHVILALTFKLWFTPQLLSWGLIYLLRQNFKWNIAVSFNSQMRQLRHGMGNKAPHDHIPVNRRDKYPTELAQNLLPPSLGDRQKPSKVPEKTPRDHTQLLLAQEIHTRI